MKKFTSVVFALGLLGCHSSSSKSGTGTGGVNADSPQPGSSTGTPALSLAVSGVSAQPGSDGTSATVTWTTSVAADGQVEVGTTTSYGTWSVYAGAATTSHSIVVTDLAPATAYHFRVRSEDGSGNHVFSDDAVFTTATPGGVADGGTGATPPPPPTAKPHRFCGWLQPTGWVPIDQDPNYATTFGEGSAVIFQHTTTGGGRTLLIPTIGVVDNNEAGYARTMLYDDNLRAQHEDAIVSLVMTKKYDGIDLDYEHLSDSDRDAYSKFTAELAAKLHAQGKTLSHAVGGLTSARFSSWDYAALAQSSDQLHIMGYDYHFLGSHPGPVAPLGWIQNVVAWAASVNGGATKAKFLLGLPNYGLAGSDSGTTAWFGSAMDSIALTGGSYATTTTHMASCPYTNGVAMAAGRAPNATGTAQGHLYFDDLASMEEKVSAAQAVGLGGITYWTIGGEPDRPGNVSFFDMIRSHFPR
jgi:hypothetical protein